MKFSLMKEDLLYAVSAVERAVSSKNTLPILNGIMITAINNTVRFRATDLEVAVECIINAAVEEEGETVIPGRRFAAMVKLLPGSEIMLSGGHDRLKVEYNGGRQSLPCLPAEEFPALPRCEGSVSTRLPVRVFKRLVRQTGIAASNDEVRPIFTAIYSEFFSDKLNMVATNTHRLACSSIACSSNAEGTFLIPNRALQEVSRLANDSDDINITGGNNQVFFSFANIVFTTRVIMGNYPDYHQVIPDANTYINNISVERTSFIQVLERAALVSRETGRNKGNVVQLAVNMEEGLLEVSAEVPDEGSIRENLPISGSGSEITINFNARYLLDVLKVLDTDLVMLNMTGLSTPCIITPCAADDEEAQSSSYIYLLLPVRVSK